jgi:MFS family permease
MSASQKALWVSRVSLFLCVFLPFSLGQFMHALLRNANAVLVPDLVRTFSINPGQLGLLTSTFFFSVVLAQLPTSAALERHGPYKVQLVLLLLAAVGALMFATSRSFAQLVLARAVIGFGVGGTLMTAVKAVATRMPAEKLPSSVAIVIAAGGVGSAAATMPMRRLLEYTDWRGLFFVLAAATAAVALLSWMVKPRVVKLPAAAPRSFHSLIQVLRVPAFRRTISLVLVSHWMYWGVQGLWVGRWLSDAGRLPEVVVAYLLYLSMASVIFGAIAVGMITEWAGRRGIVPLDVAAIGVALYVLVQIAIVADYAPSFPMLAVLFTLVGTITGIEYTIVQQSMPKELGSAASSCLNMLIFLGAFVMQAGFGQIIALWHPDAYGHYPVMAYRVAFGIMVLLQLPGLVTYFLGRRPVKCAVPQLIPEEAEYEVSTLRSSR